MSANRSSDQESARAVETREESISSLVLELDHLILYDFGFRKKCDVWEDAEKKKEVKEKLLINKITIKWAEDIAQFISVWIRVQVFLFSGNVWRVEKYLHNLDDAASNGPTRPYTQLAVNHMLATIYGALN